MMTCYTNSVAFSRVANENYAESKGIVEFIRFIDSKLSHENHFTSDSLDSRTLEFWVEWCQSATQTKDPQLWFRELFNAFPEYKEFFETSASLFEEKSITMQSVLKWRQKDWWEADHLLWFAAWAAPALAELDLRNKSWKRADLSSSLFDLKRDVPKLGDDFFIKDRGGHGRVFVPALFVLAWYKQEFKIQGFESTVHDFEAATGVPMEVYRNVLYDHDFPKIDIP